MRLPLAVFTLPILAAVPLHAQEAPSGPRIRMDGIELTVGGRVQTQFNTTSVDDAQPSQILIRRARIEIGARINEYVSGTVQPDFGGDDLDLKDAYLSLDLSPGFRILAGKAYRPFGLLEQTSSKRILPIERGLRVRGLDAADEYAFLSSLAYTNRDIGLQIRGAPDGAPLGLTYAAGILRGPLHGQVGAQDSYQFAGRLTVGLAPLVRLGGGWSSRDFSAGVGSTPDLTRGHAFELDLEIGSFAPGIHVLAEFSRGDLDPFSNASFWGGHTWLAYRSGRLSPAIEALEPVFRASISRSESDGSVTPMPGGTLLTPGINFYFTPLNRVMINYDVWRGEDDSADAESFKLMFQLGF